MLSKDNQFQINNAEIKHLRKENQVLRQQILILKQKTNQKIQQDETQQLLDVIQIQREKMELLQNEFCQLEERYEELLENYSNDLQKARPKAPQLRDETYLEMQIEMETNKQSNLEKLIAELQKKQQQEFTNLKAQMHQSDKQLFTTQQYENKPQQIPDIQLQSIGKNANLNPLKGVSARHRQNSSKHKSRERYPF